MNKKDIDVLQLMRESILKANKDLGFAKTPAVLQEQKGAFEEEFDPEKHMPKFAITKNWGTRGTLDAKEIDAVLANVIDTTKTSAIERYKDSLAKLNDVLSSVKKEEDQLPVAAQKQFNLPETISSLQLKNLIHSIIYNLDPQSAGKIYELLMSRIAGGFTPSQPIGSEDLIIADFLDGDGNFVSLKTLKKSTDSSIKGSKFNLASAVAKKEKVIFIVNEKDKEADPFKMGAFSFCINKDNYFNFILGTENAPDMNLVLKEINDLNERFAKLEGDIRVQRMKKSGEEKERQLSIDAIAKQLVDARAKIGNVRNQTLAPAQEAFDEAPEGTPEKKAAEEKLRAAQTKYDEAVAIEQELKAELEARRTQIKKLKGTEKLDESLEVTKTIEAIASNAELASDIYKIIFNEPNANKEVVRKKFMSTIEDFIKKVKADPYQAKVLLNSIAASTKGTEQWDLLEIPKSIVQASGAKLIKIDNLKTLSKAIDYAESLTGMELGFEAETDPKISEQYRKFLYELSTLKLDQQNDIKALFNNNEKKYIAAKQNLQKNFFPFVELYTQFANTQLQGKVITPLNPIKKAGNYSILSDLSKTRPDESLANAPVGSSEKYLKGKEVFQKVDDFWKKMSSFEGILSESLNEAEEPKAEEGETKKVQKDTQFNVSLAKARKIALATRGGDLDESYPTIIVSATNLKESSTQSMELFKRWAEPIYRGMHELTNGVNKYFIQDEIAGLDKAEKGIQEVTGKIGEVKVTGLGASALRESKEESVKEPVKKSAFDDILEELLK
jgi:hypothetical protein